MVAKPDAAYFSAAASSLGSADRSDIEEGHLAHDVRESNFCVYMLLILMV